MKTTLSDLSDFWWTKFISYFTSYDYLIDTTTFISESYDVPNMLQIFEITTRM